MITDACAVRPRDVLLEIRLGDRPSMPYEVRKETPNGRITVLILLAPRRNGAAQRSSAQRSILLIPDFEIT